MVKSAQSPPVRFRTELAPPHVSWLAIVLVYALAAAVLFLLFRFLIGFNQFGQVHDQAVLAGQNRSAAQRLIEDLADPPSGLPVERALARFAEDFVAQDGGRQDPTGTGAAVEPVLAELQEGGASRARVRERAQRLLSTWESRAQAAERRAAELRLGVALKATLMGFVVAATAIGGALLFLRRSRQLYGLLARRTAELEEVDASRRLFFANASHELRTPVTAMMGEAEVALTGDHRDDGTMEQALRHIVAQARFLGHRIDEMIGLAQTSDGKLQLDAVPLDYRDVVAEAVADARSFARSVEVDMDVTVPDQPVTVRGDALWLKRALLAVIENALKFSPMQGKVTVELSQKDEFARVRITDQGPGVVPDELPLIFEAYYQTDTGKDRGGSGLGLSMTRWVAEEHGGRAFARNVGHPSRPEGCTVTIDIALERSA
ncbi:sensor histidine kinase [Croceibacterium soli]|nr:HAMP domain-containing sensor histidine kinase [Croceibacterium soli]